MAKIMFSERYGLQQGVMDGTKPMTRRIVKCPKKFKSYEDEWCDDIQLEFYKKPCADYYYDCMVVDGDGRELGRLPLRYKIGDVVAIAQSYKDAGVGPCEIVGSIVEGQNMYTLVTAKESPGWTNKMFVREDLMPHHIQITDLWFERLQDISDEDCLKEGVLKWMDGYIVTGIMEHNGKSNKCFDTPREAFAALIDRISGKGTWKSNPWMVVYTFKRVD